jgi:hypothetical protein
MRARHAVDRNLEPSAWCFSEGSFGGYPALWRLNAAGVLTTAEYHQNDEEK